MVAGGRETRKGRTNVKQQQQQFKLNNKLSNKLTTTVTTTVTTKTNTANSTTTSTSTQTLPQEVTTSFGLHNRQASINVLNERNFLNISITSVSLYIVSNY